MEGTATAASARLVGTPADVGGRPDAATVTLARDEIEEALASDLPLGDLGVGSLGFLRLVDAVEQEFGIEVDATMSRLRGSTVESLTAELVAAGVPA